MDLQEGGDAPGSSASSYDQGAPDSTKVSTAKFTNFHDFLGQLIESAWLNPQGDAVERNSVSEDSRERTCLSRPL